MLLNPVCCPYAVLIDAEISSAGVVRFTCVIGMSPKRFGVAISPIGYKSRSKVDPRELFFFFYLVTTRGDTPIKSKTFNPTTQSFRDSRCTTDGHNQNTFNFQLITNHFKSFLHTFSWTLTRYMYMCVMYNLKHMPN